MKSKIRDALKTSMLHNMPEKPLHIAIVGGGLCGISLAIALTNRSIPFTLYEARSSFTEIGAGINFGPNALQAFRIIDPKIADAIYGLVTRNEPGKEDVFINFPLGAPSGEFEDGYYLHSLNAPPTGSMSVGRNELLQMLAASIDSGNVKFNKKLADLKQDDDGVTLVFGDGTEDRVSLVIACDGAHSTARKLVLGSDNPAATPKFSHSGGYRGIFSMDVLEGIIGRQYARNSHLWIGPNAYVIMYPMAGAEKVNIGFWPRKDDDWNHDSWVLHDQKENMLKDFAEWGPTMQKMMQAMSEDTQFWATFHYSVKPDTYFKGRACLIGDAAHAMTPHFGQGAAQSMEDACVMAEVLNEVDASGSAEFVEAAFRGYEATRRPRFEEVLEKSIEVFRSVWSGFWRPDLTSEDVKEFQKAAEGNFRWLWECDIQGQGERAKAEMEKILNEKTNVPNGGPK